MTEIILIVIALSLDSFVASLAYGAGKIKIPFRSALVISAVGAGFFAFSLIAARLAESFLSPELARAISFCILFFLGFSSLFQSAIKTFLRKRRSAKIGFTYADFRFVLDIYLDETKADSDQSKNLSVKEACYLAFALSLDSLVTGLGCGFGLQSPIPIILSCFVVGVISVMTGCSVGSRLSAGREHNLSWLSGILLMLLAALRVV